MAGETTQIGIHIVDECCIAGCQHASYKTEPFGHYSGDPHAVCNELPPEKIVEAFNHGGCTHAVVRNSSGVMTDLNIGNLDELFYTPRLNFIKDKIGIIIVK